MEGQIDDLIGGDQRRPGQRNERVLVTTLTKKMAEDLTDYFRASRHPGAVYARRRGDHRAAWRSSGICGWASSTCWWASTCCGRVWTCRRCLWWPFWTPTRRASSAARPSLIQTIGRAARNAEGLVILYADTITPSMRRGHGRDGAPPENSGRLQQGPRHRPEDHHQGSSGRCWRSPSAEDSGTQAPRASPRS